MFNKKSQATDVNGKPVKECRQCRQEIPKKASKCHHCQSKQPKYSYKHLIGLFVVMILFGIVSNFLEEGREERYQLSEKGAIPNYQPRQVTVEAEDFDYISQDFVNLFVSYNNRTITGAAQRGTQWLLTNEDRENDYCYIESENVSGWLMCGWLK